MKTDSPFVIPDDKENETWHHEHHESMGRLHQISASFLLIDSPARLNTMRQFNQNYLGVYTAVADQLYKSLNNKPVYLILAGFSGLIGHPLTHEEGHRSVLTYKNIGSISRPFFNKHGAAYVQGVTDQTLLNLRNSDLPNYIRLHTAGLESDYMLARQMESRMVFNRRYSRLLFFDHFVRRFGLFNYYAYGLIKYDFDLQEETDELKRDIVGHDVYGAVRHLHRPDMEFYRYTRYGDLTSEEIEMVRRAGWRSFLNLVSPLLFGKSGFQISPDLAFNFSLGYTMSPYGDFIDQNVWFQWRNRQMYGIYFRQHQNKNTWFPAAGFSVYDLALDSRGRISTDLNFHGWQQPTDFSFTGKDGFRGGAFDGIFRYKFYSGADSRLQSLSIDLGILAKTKGFMPEEMHLKEHVGLRLGFSLYY